jgi:hypothetical protein
LLDPFFMKLVRLFAALTTVVLAGSIFAQAPITRTEIPNAAQPQLAADSDGRVWLVYGQTGEAPVAPAAHAADHAAHKQKSHQPGGRSGEIFVTSSKDGGATFEPSVRIAALPSLMLGRRRGPRIAAHGDDVTVTVMTGELFAFSSKDGGNTWAGPTLINDVPRSAREGLNDLAVAPEGRLFAVWLDLRGDRTQLYGSESKDGGATWSANTVVYRAPAGNTVCECCHPSARFNARGDLAVMWRNAIGGDRDMWFAVRPAGAREFGAAAKLGEGSWALKACPMDGGALFNEGDAFATIWQRSGAVFLARPGRPEQKIAAGLQPVAAAVAGRSIAVWQQGADLWSSSLAAGAAPALLAPGARFPAVLALPDGKRILVAYERGSGVVVQPL